MVNFIVPAHSVGEDQNGRFVYILNPKEGNQGVIERRPVTIGDLTESGIEILTGLKEGERVVTAGVSKIKDGQIAKFSGTREN